MRPTLEHSAEARTWYFSLLGFLGSTLLGVIVGVSLEPFLWLALSRPLVALVLVLLPNTAMGSHRPYLLGLAGLSLGATLGWNSSSLWLYSCLLTLYLVLDVSLDGQLIEHCPANEWLGRLAQLLGARTLGLVTGMILNGATVPTSWLEQADRAMVLAIIVILAAVSESPETAGWTWGVVHSPLPRLAVAIDSFRAALSRDALPGTGVLTLVSLLAGTTGCQVFPFALLTGERLTQWWGVPGLWVVMFILLVILTLALERLAGQTLVCLIYPLFLLALGLSLEPTSNEARLALQVASGLAILVAYRQCPRSPSIITPPLEGAMLNTVWLLGLLVGAQATHGMALRSLRAGQGVGAVLLLLVVCATVKNWKSSTRVTSAYIIDSESDRRARGQGLHGDKKLDFEAAPNLPYKKRSHWLSRIWYALTIRIPVAMILAILFGLTLAGIWQAGDKKSAWKAQMEGAWTAVKTELFLTSIQRRTEEELLAANRIPRDWSEFIASSFQLDGRPMKDRDFWGTPLNFQTSARQIEISSAGADRKFGTPDDIQRVVKLPDGAR